MTSHKWKRIFDGTDSTNACACMNCGIVWASEAYTQQADLPVCQLPCPPWGASRSIDAYDFDKNIGRLWDACCSYIPDYSGFTDTHEQWCKKQIRIFAEELITKTIKNLEAKDCDTESGK